MDKLQKIMPWIKANKTVSMIIGGLLLIIVLCVFG